MGVRFGEFEFDPELFELRRDGRRVPLERQVFDVLGHLIAHRDRVVTKEELLDEIWGDRFVSESALTSRIKAARKALGDDGVSQRFIETTRGRGYRFVAPTRDGGLPDEPVATTAGASTAGADFRPAAPPSGTITFLFTDVEGSTRLWEQHPAQMHDALQRHDELLVETIERHGGFVFTSSGDSFAAAFSSVHEAVAASVEGQAALAAEAWPPECPISVRMGLHVGEARERDDDYFGPAVNKAARIMAGGHGGQILASSAIAAVYDGADLIDLGEHRLKDLSARERLYQIGSATFPPLRTLEAVRHNLPVERTPLIGRDEEVGAVVDLVRDHRLVTLLGIGGTGKTRLATAVAADLATDFDDGVWFVDLVPVRSFDGIAEAIASAAGLQLNGPNLVDSLAELIAGRRMLVVLDNCEHVTDAVADVVDLLLARTSDVAWLATSREPLQLPDERQVHVAPLAVADDPEAPAVQLFSAAAGRVGASIDPADAGRVAEICTNLDGIPLSIELAAAQLRHLQLGELAARLDRRFDILTRSGGGRMRRQASLLAVLEDTWGMLDEHETELLLLLAAFPSSFTVDAVEGISAGRDVGIPTATLAGLIDRSLIAGDGLGGHRLLETVKLFARQEWDAIGASTDYLERHTEWVLGHLNGYAAQDWFTSFEVFRWATSHYDDHRAVEARLTADGRTDELTALLRALTIAYTYTSGTRASAVIDRVERLTEVLDLTTRQRGLLRLVAASAGLPSRRPDVIASQSAAALEDLRADAAPEELAATLIVASWMLVFSDFPRAVSMLEEATTVADRAAAPAIADAARAYTAGYAALVGRIDESVAILDDLRRRLEGRPFDYAWSLHHLFRLAVNVVADPTRARELGDDLERWSATVSANVGMGWGLPLCTCVTVATCGNVDETRRRVVAAEAHARRTSDDDGLPDLLLSTAALAWRLGDLDRARRWLTTVRHSPKPTANFQLTIMYRLLRNEVGLLDVNPLDEARLEEVYDEAVEWMGSLAPIDV